VRAIFKIVPEPQDMDDGPSVVQNGGDGFRLATQVRR
jgi:hypothetical protein